MSLEQKISELTLAVERLTGVMQNSGDRLATPVTYYPTAPQAQVLGDAEVDPSIPDDSLDTPHIGVSHGTADVMGRAWDSRIHRPGKTFYKSGAHIGKWQYRPNLTEDYIKMIEAELDGGRELSNNPLMIPAADAPAVQVQPVPASVPQPPIAAPVAQFVPQPPVAAPVPAPVVPVVPVAPLALVWPADFATATNIDLENLVRGWIQLHGDTEYNALTEALGVPGTAPAAMVGAEWQAARTWIIGQLRAKTND